MIDKLGQFAVGMMLVLISVAFVLALVVLIIGAVQFIGASLL